MSNNFQGSLYSLFSVALFAIVAVMAKLAVVEYHVLQILFLRQAIVFISTLPSLKSSFPKSLKTTFPKTHALRLLGAFVALSFGIYALSVLPLSTAITLGFTEVFFTALLAIIFLHERVYKHRVFAVLLGFLGVVIIMRPGVDGFFNIYTFVPIISALGASVAFISVRKLSQTESTATLLIYQSVFIGLFAGAPLLWLWKTPDVHGFLLLISMGILATIANWIAVKALRLAEATVVGNIKYVQLAYATLLGYVIFDEIPDIYTTIGAVLIITSALYMLNFERKNKNFSN